MKTNIKEILKKINFKKWLIFFSIIFCIYIVFYAVFTYVPFFKNKQDFIIVSDSMEPTIMRGDLVIVNTAFDADNLQEDDIIAFYQDLNSDGTEEIVVHYIAEISQNELNETVYRTKHEGVTSYINWDAWSLTQDGIIGTHYITIPKLGSILLFLGSAFGKVVLLIDIVVIFAIVDYFSKDKKSEIVKIDEIKK